MMGWDRSCDTVRCAILNFPQHLRMTHMHSENKPSVVTKENVTVLSTYLVHYDEKI